MLIRDATFVVVDTETTGTNAGTDRLLEIAAVKVQGGRIVDQFARLVNPQRSVPRRITMLTGITTAMVFDKPPTAEVLPAFLDFVGDAVLVAHNMPFDIGFLNAEFQRAGLAPIPNETLCTLRLARRLLRGLHSKALSSLIDFFDLVIENRHRALGDALAATHIFLRFVDQVYAEQGIETVEALLRFQHRSYRRVGTEPGHLQAIREAILPQLPDRPGVYFMKNKKGEILYIGKAKSLRDRVRSYFTAIEAHPARTRKLLQAVRAVTWTETGSELAALLLESRLIKAHQPRFNRAQRRYPQPAFHPAGRDAPGAAHRLEHVPQRRRGGVLRPVARASPGRTGRRHYQPVLSPSRVRRRYVQEGASLYVCFHRSLHGAVRR